MNLEKNTIISHYKILSEIGKGGMGEVYLAQDTELDRKVAVKFLSEELGKESDKVNRFIQEAKAASALNHPNILTVHEIGTWEETRYIATEYIEGRTLRDLIGRRESVHLNRVLKIGIQVAEALSAAHQAGIAHRDIKPENIMVREDGYVKVLDFGLAKLVEKPGKEGDISLEGETKALVKTTPGLVMGTVSYMSPEQARGKDTDERTDIWSLGVVLYEMLSGKVPFEGETVNHTIVAILETEPKLLENVPDELQRIIRKTLTKEKDSRYQTARDLVIDLKNLRRELDLQGELERSIIPNKDTEAAIENETQFSTDGSADKTASGQAPVTQNVTTSSSSLEYAVTQAKSHKAIFAFTGLVLIGVVSAAGYFAFFNGSGPNQIDSIAVMPFVNETGDPELEYLADGMTDSLIESLSAIPDLSVKARSSVFRYKGKAADTRQIGTDLSVEVVALGRLTKENDDLTVRLEVVNAESETVLWSSSFTHRLDSLAALQKEIAQDVSKQLRKKLSAREEREVTRSYAENSESQRHYLLGRFHLAKRDIREFEKAITQFEKAIELEPGNALAYAGLADAYALTPIYNKSADPKIYIPRARTAAVKAIELDDESSEAYASLARIQSFYERDFSAAERTFQRSIELDPEYANARLWYSQHLSILGRHDEALAEVRKSLDIEPVSLPANRVAGACFVFAGQFEAAEKQYGKTIELYPADPAVKLNLAWLYATENRLSKAGALMMDSIRLSERDPVWLARYEEAYKNDGWNGVNRVQLELDLEQKRSQPFYRSYTIAVDYAALGKIDKAIEYLERAAEERDINLNFVRVDDAFDGFRSDPRFRKLVRRVGFPD